MNTKTKCVKGNLQKFTPLEPKVVEAGSRAIQFRILCIAGYPLYQYSFQAQLNAGFIKHVIKAEVFSICISLQLADIASIAIS